MTEGKLVLLTRIYDPYTSHLIRATLESYDIPCFLFDIELQSTIPQSGLGGIRVMVPNEYLTEAQKILQDYEDGKIEVKDNE